MKETMCDTCLSPGACCKSITLSGEIADPMLQFHAPMSHERAEHLSLYYGLPFRPLVQMDNGVWRWWCTNLQRDGRCGDYENRPHLCRAYLPGQDGLCVHYQSEMVDK